MREITGGTTSFAQGLGRALSERLRALAPLGVAVLALGSATTSALVPVTQVAAATGVNVFVGYADDFRGGAAFPNPWDGSPNVTFDGCSPAASCTFDAGAVRVENDTASPVVVEQVDVNIGTCHYTWAGASYPVTLAPNHSLITTQRASGAASGCTGPTPLTFDSSDIPSAFICTQDNIIPTVDVTVNGITTSATDSGQILNTGGVDPGGCGATTNESTQWVAIGGIACPGQSLSLAPLSQTHSVSTTATVTATFTNSCGNPLPGASVVFNVSSGPNAGVTGSSSTDPSGNASFSYSSLLPGTDTLNASVTNAATPPFTTTSNDVNVIWTLAFGPGGGSFVIGDQNAAVGTSVTFWGAQWAKDNSLSGGAAPRSFKGFAENPTTPSCGVSWSADPGNSTQPPDGPLPDLMGVIVTSSADKSGSTISGNTVHIVIVKTDPGYDANPGHAGTGAVVAVVC